MASNIQQSLYSVVEVKVQQHMFFPLPVLHINGKHPQMCGLPWKMANKGAGEDRGQHVYTFEIMAYSIPLLIFSFFIFVMPNCISFLYL